MIDIIATDHAPHTEADKKCEFTQAAFGISGLETALGSLMGLVHGGELSLTTLIARLTCEPARILEATKSWARWQSARRPISPSLTPTGNGWLTRGNFASKGKNTPLAGSMLKGKVMATIFQGKLVYKRSIHIKIERRE